MAKARLLERTTHERLGLLFPFPADTYKLKWAVLCREEKANKSPPATKLFSPAQLIFPLVTGIKESRHNT